MEENVTPFVQEGYQQNPPQLPVASDEVKREAKHAYSLSLLWIAMFGIISQVLVMVAAVIVRLVMGVDELPPTVLYLVNFLPMYCIGFPIFLLLNKNMTKTPPEQHSMNAGQFVIALIMCFAFMVGGGIIGNMINLILGALFGFQVDSSALTDGILGEGRLVICIFAVLFAPVIEELIFRKVLIDRIRRYGDGTAILVSGIMFGLFHGNFSQCFFAAMLGMFFAFIYIRTGKVQYTIAMHMIINFIGSVVSGALLKNLDLEHVMELAANQDMDALMGLLPKLIPLAIFVVVEYGLAIAGLVLLIVNRRKFRVAPPMVPIEKGTHARVVMCNAGFILLVLFCIAMFVFTGIQLYSGS